MRLIDADVLMDLLEKGWKTTSRDTFTHHTIDRTDVEGTPTIEAIPIEWLLEWEQKYNESLPLFFRGETVIKDVIRDWRAENETD